MHLGHSPSSTNSLYWPKACDCIRFHDSGLAIADLWPVQANPIIWTAFDAYMTMCTQNNLEVLFTLCYTPDLMAIPVTGAPAGERSALSNCPPNPVYFDYFLDQLFDRAAGRIAIVEAWNEANAPGFWCGSDAQLLAQMQMLSEKCKQRGIKVTTPSTCPQPAQTLSQGLDHFLNIGLGQYADYAAVHGYLNQSENAPDIQVEFDNCHKSLTHYHSSLPLIDTESGYMDSAFIPDAQKAQWMTDWYTIRQQCGISKAYWYQYANFTSARWGAPLVNQADGTLNVAGQALATAYAA